MRRVKLVVQNCEIFITYKKSFIAFFTAGMIANNDDFYGKVRNLSKSGNFLFDGKEPHINFVCLCSFGCFCTDSIPTLHRTQRQSCFSCFIAIFLLKIMALSLKKKHTPQKTSDAIREAAPLMNIGFELAGTIGGFGLMGWFIDKYAQTSPFWFVVLLIFGLVGGMIKLVRTVINYSNKQKTLKSILKSTKDTDSDTSQSQMP